LDENLTPSAIADAASFLQGALLLVLAAVCGVTDVSSRRVYNYPVLAGIICGLLLSYVRGGVWSGSVSGISLGTSGICMTAGLVLFGLFYLIGGIGAGDVKLAAAMGALVANIQFYLWFMVSTAFAGVPLAVGILLFKGDLRGGIFRSLKGMLRWKYRRPPDSGSAAAGAGTEPAEPPTPQQIPITVPYAVAMGLGLILTILLFMDRTATLPFF
jgi:prepilin peptidase CpaA